MGDNHNVHVEFKNHLNKNASTFKYMYINKMQTNALMTEFIHQLEPTFKFIKGTPIQNSVKEYVGFKIDYKF